MAISVEHFSRTYGDLTAVDDLSFEVASGEIELANPSTWKYSSTSTVK